MKKRTFSVSRVVVSDVKDMSIHYGITKQTIARFAVIHGIEHLKRGYLPKRNKHKRIKGDIEIYLDKNTWDEFDQLYKSLKYKVQEPIPEWEVIELFLKAELRQLMEIGYKVMSDKHNFHPMSVKYNVPEVVYKRIEKKQKMMGLTDAQMGKYLLLRGILTEYRGINFDLMDSDDDILEYMKKEHFDRKMLEVKSLLRYLVQSGRIWWMK